MDNIQFENVTVTAKANVYFDGGVVSHSIVFPDGSRKTLGIIYPGRYTFNTAAPERMEIIAGECVARIAGDELWTRYPAGSEFAVPGDSSFDVEVDDITEYICSFG